MATIWTIGTTVLSARRKDQRPERSGGRRALRRTEQDRCRSIAEARGLAK